MGLNVTRSVLPSWLARLLCGTAVLCLAGGISLPAYAQTNDALIGNVQTNPNAQLLLESDELVYDINAKTISAVGGVQIDYDGNRLVARQVTYDQKTGRLKAMGKVEIVEKDGNRIYAENLDVTDDFREGFVNALRVESADNTRFAAESAERIGGEITTFNNGIYTACEPCRAQPDKAPLWQVRAQKIVWNGKKKTIRFERGRFEMFGMPLAFLPAFEIADPTVKRKSGFLIPSYKSEDDLGSGVSVPYFWALAPNYDLTLTGTYYSKQGFLGEAEWRHRLTNGEYSIKVAGISQQDPNAFHYTNIPDDQNVDRQNTGRGLIASKGAININPRWTVGWNVMAQTDKSFAYRYGIDDYDNYNITNQIYLTGINDRNYFDLRFYNFLVQEAIENSSPNSYEGRQPWVMPSLDYAYTPTQSVWGGELNFDVNLQALHREKRSGSNGFSLTDRAGYISGIEGNDGRLTAEVEWKRTFIAPNGLVITPLLALRGDGMYVDSDTVGVVRSEAFRGMATAGLEARWPILFSATSSTHVLEPTAQLFVRNNEPYAGDMPNEDAQSFVFDASSLFERDKFSGYDRVEGGTRVNLGVRYSGTFNNGWSLNGIAGQSFHIAGLNSFDTDDFVNVGAESGLEDDRSDYVAMIGANYGRFNVTTGGRFDKETFDVRRAEVASTTEGKFGTAFVKYAFIDKQETYGFEQDRHEVTVGGSAKVTPNWRVLGSGTYDLVSETLVKRKAAIAYDDECFTYSMYYQQEQPVAINGVERDKTTSFGFNISFRTLWGVGEPVDIGGI
ncbi:LPS-assembly protein LptD [Phyllobacterium sp. YR531]|uniref:LPS-assembly protein LptD n=1 Tax=Phyllobacterium sp. YR531 TaxID=1144343 RepID=UPI00026F5BF1|nr:LPS-assembly protein LptD [Phyllobacterium sp. YR531]EJM98769.1 organic solvent tolerance protein OstA [Phyllobacterium sp. YR531]